MVHLLVHGNSGLWIQCDTEHDLGEEVMWNLIRLGVLAFGYWKRYREAEELALLVFGEKRAKQDRFRREARSIARKVVR